MKIKVRIEAEVYPTESPEKVVKAIRNIFPGLGAEVKWLDSLAVVKGESDDLDSLLNLKNMIKRRKIRAAAKSILKSGVEENKLVFYLNKQAAYAGQVSFTEPIGESPLPPIKVEIEAEDVNSLINWLTE